MRQKRCRNTVSLAPPFLVVCQAIFTMKFVNYTINIIKTANLVTYYRKNDISLIFFLHTAIDYDYIDNDVKFKFPRKQNRNLLVISIYTIGIWIFFFTYDFIVFQGDCKVMGSQIYFPFYSIVDLVYFLKKIYGYNIYRL